jgi:hypothetical protein
MYLLIQATEQHQGRIVSRHRLGREAVVAYDRACAQLRRKYPQAIGSLIYGLARGNQAVGAIVGDREVTMLSVENLRLSSVGKY